MEFPSATKFGMLGFSGFSSETSSLVDDDITEANFLCGTRKYMKVFTSQHVYLFQHLTPHGHNIDLEMAIPLS